MPACTPVLPICRAVHKRLALHHYATKSRDEFVLKMVRGSAMKRQR